MKDLVASALQHPSARYLAFFIHLSGVPPSLYLFAAYNTCCWWRTVQELAVCGRHLRKTFQRRHWLFGYPDSLPYHFPIFPISLYLAPPHPGFLAIFLSWIFCPTHSRISIPAATDLCALLLTRFAPDKVTLLILRKPPVKVHLDTYLSFKHETLKAWLFKSGSWRSRQAPRLCPRGSQSSGETTTQSSQLVEYYQLRHIQLS